MEPAMTIPSFSTDDSLSLHAKRLRLFRLPLVGLLSFVGLYAVFTASQHDNRQAGSTRPASITMKTGSEDEPTPAAGAATAALLPDGPVEMPTDLQGVIARIEQIHRQGFVGRRGGMIVDPPVEELAPEHQGRSVRAMTAVLARWSQQQRPSVGWDYPRLEQRLNLFAGSSDTARAVQPPRVNRPGGGDQTVPSKVAVVRPKADPNATEGPPARPRVEPSRPGRSSAQTPTPAPAVARPAPEPGHAVPPAVPPQAASVVITNPLESGGVVHYLLDDAVFSLHPGQSQHLGAGRAWQIRFHRGGNFGQAGYLLTEGVYSFQVTARGWDLTHQPAW
jgi:hypothetical protein